MTFRLDGRSMGLLAPALVVLALPAFVAVPASYAVISAPVALVIPGFTACRALGVRLKNITLQLAASAALSMAFYALLALAIFVLTGEITRARVALGTTAIVAVLSIGPVSRREATYHTNDLNRGHAALLFPAVAASLLVVAGSLALLPKGAATPYSSLSLAGRGSWPSRIHGAIPITVANHTERTVTYVVIATLERRVIWRQSIQVRAGDAWTGDVVVGPKDCGHMYVRLREAIHVVAALSLGPSSRSRDTCGGAFGGRGLGS